MRFGEDLKIEANTERNVEEIKDPEYNAPEWIMDDLDKIKLEIMILIL